MSRNDQMTSSLSGKLLGAKLSRRALLRGVGVTMGLPCLEAMTPMARSAFAAPTEAAARPVRMAFVFVPNGVIQPKWECQGEGESFELSETLSPLAPFKSKLNVIDGLALDNGRAHKDGAGDHARAGATFLTSARPLKTSSRVHLGVSVDQICAQQLAGQTRLASIELGLVGSRNAGSCDSGYSCAYSSNISWRNETTPMAKETIPRLAFERLFGSGDTHQRRERNAVRRSILDIVSEDAKQLINKVGDTDRRKLDEYFSGIRELELRIDQTDAADRESLPDLDVPMGRVEAFREHARLMFDLMVVAFQTDATRVATFMLDNAGGNRSYTEIGVKEAHHGLSHHRNEPELVGKLEKIDRYLVEQYAYFLEKLDSVADGNGTLLDNSMIMYGSGLGDGNRHTHHDLPIVMAGGARGQIKTGRRLKYEKDTPAANLYLSMLDMMGTPAERIGDSNGRLPNLS